MRDDLQLPDTSGAASNKVEPSGPSSSLHEQKPKKNHSFVALYDYQGRTNEDLSFRAGDKLEVLNASQEGWWYARLLLDSGSTRPGQKLQGYIPANYVAPDQSIEAEP